MIFETYSDKSSTISKRLFRSHSFWGKLFAATANQKDKWNQTVAIMLKNEIRQNLGSYESLAKKLGKTTRTKINRSTFRASYFLKAMAALGVKRIEVPDFDDSKQRA